MYISDLKTYELEKLDKVNWNRFIYQRSKFYELKKLPY